MPTTIRLPNFKITSWLGLARGQTAPTWAALHALPGPASDHTLLLCSDSFRIHAIHTQHPALAADNVHVPPGSYCIQDHPDTSWSITLDPDMRTPNFSDLAHSFPFTPPAPSSETDAPRPAHLHFADWPDITLTVAKALHKADLVALFTPQEAPALLRFDGFAPLRRAAAPDCSPVLLNPLFVVQALALPRYPQPRFSPPVVAQIYPNCLVRLGEWLAFSLFLQTRIPSWMARQPAN